MSEQEVDQHNRREAWKDIAEKLHGAEHLLELTQGSFDDLVIYAPETAGYAEQLQPLIDQVRRAANDADESATK
jgi:hypothetical protein